MPEEVVPPVRLKDGRRVKLGRIRPEKPPEGLQLIDYVDEGKLRELPASTNWRAKASKSLKEMLGNDQAGDCVIASKVHAAGLMTANDSDSGGEVVGTTRETLAEYQRLCGPGDNGCNIEEVLKEMRRGGISIGGKKHKIDAYVLVDHRNKELVKAALNLMPGLAVGVNLPQEWTCTDCTWDVSRSRIVGGHDVCAVDYDEEGVHVSTWGGTALITWEAFTDPRWVEEVWMVLSEDWYNLDKLSAGGIDVAKLRDDMERIAGGDVPDVPTPTPTPPGPTPTPTPPAPPSPTPPGPPWAWLWDLLWTLIEWLSKHAGQKDRLRAQVEAMPWSKIIEIILQLLEEWLKSRQAPKKEGGAEEEKPDEEDTPASRRRQGNGTKHPQA